MIENVFFAMNGRLPNLAVYVTRGFGVQEATCQIPESQPREQAATGRNAGTIILAGSGIARSMDSTAREQLAARRTRCASAAGRERSGSRAPRVASATGRDIKAMWRARGDAAALIRTPQGYVVVARVARAHLPMSTSPPVKVPELTCSPVDLSWPAV